MTTIAAGATADTATEWVPFPKIHRLFRPAIITEKIDGTNAAVGVTENGVVYAQSRKRIIYPDDDNFGFATWVKEHEDELRVGLGVGLHFGEWWGRGIQRGYGLDERRFSLFNTSRWGDDATRPPCCHVVPTISELQVFDTNFINAFLRGLGLSGSLAAPGFMDPEGIVVYHPQGNVAFKATLVGDDRGKSHGA